MLVSRPAVYTVLSRFEDERSAGNAADNQPFQQTGAASRPS
jgi:hypothetical protein